LTSTALTCKYVTKTGSNLRPAQLEVSFILALLSTGKTIEQVVQAYSLSRITPEAIQKAISLADQALLRSVKRRQLAAA
jgi:uncharacterized protein (DUF433 family)